MVPVKTPKGGSVQPLPGADSGNNDLNALLRRVVRERAARVPDPGPCLEAASSEELKALPRAVCALLEALPEEAS